MTKTLSDCKAALVVGANASFVIVITGVWQDMETYTHVNEHNDEASLVPHIRLCYAFLFFT